MSPALRWASDEVGARLGERPFCGTGGASRWGCWTEAGAVAAVAGGAWRERREADLCGASAEGLGEEDACGRLFWEEEALPMQSTGNGVERGKGRGG